FGAIADNKTLTVIGQPPAFTGQIIAIQQTEAIAVVDKQGMGTPGQLVDAVFQHCNAFCEILVFQVVALLDLAIFQCDTTQGRAAIAASALKQFTVSNDQPLGES